MKSLFKALDIIEIIATTGKIGIRELSATSGMPPATIHRIVAALTQRGYLQKDNATLKYLLSSKFLTLADQIQQELDIVSIARPYLEKLMTKTRENANLCVQNGYNVIYIDHVHSMEHNLRTFTRLGGDAPLYASGVGKVFLSRFSDEKLSQFLEDVDLIRFTPTTITIPETLVREIKQVRQKGYAVDNQEKEKGVRCIAAPVLNHKGQIEAAISVSGAAQRITMKRLPALGAIVMEFAIKLSQELGYTYEI